MKNYLLQRILFLPVILLGACGVKHTSVDYGKTTVADLVAEKGEPLEEKKIPIENGKMLIYENNEKFQVKGDLVTHGFKDPKGDERTMLYWRHRFKDCATVTKKISEPKGHELPEYELKCDELGQSVIFTEGSEFVSRIIEHEKK